MIIIGSLIVLFFLVYLADLIFITVYPGHAGVLFRRFFDAGTVTDKVYDEGLNIIAPWNKMYVYDVRIKERKQTVNVLSQNGLTIEVVVSLRYHVAKGQTPILHKRVGPDYEEKIIIPSIISSVREVVGEYRPEEIYTTARHLIQDKLLVEVIEETGRIPIVYDDVIVENIALPELINNAIELKLKQQQEYLEYEFRVKKAEREIERKEKEAIGIRQFQKIVTESLSPELLQWKGIMATLELATSPNTKVIIVGGGENGLPIIFNADTAKISSSGNKKQVSSKTDELSIDDKPVDDQPYDDIFSVTAEESYENTDVKGKKADVNIKTNKR
ncbi:MAG: prohibitin family protein [Desulfamplus sp.]|nr:prohibitin family protein [Desulfamplus sp.]